MGGGGVQSVQGPGTLSPSNLLTLLKTVDGAGSGLDADLLDGQHGSYYLDMGNAAAGTLAVARGGTGLASYTAGDTLYASGTTTLAKLAIGAANTVLTSTGSAPQWVTALTLAGALSALSLTGTGLVAGRVATIGTGGLLESYASLLWDGTGNGTLTCLGIITAKPTSTAGISLDPNAATGNFTMRLTPANLTASRRTTFGDADFSFTGGGTLALGGFTLTVPATGTVGLLGTNQTWTGTNTYSAAVTLDTSSSGLTISKTTGTTLTLSSTDSTASFSFAGGGTMGGQLAITAAMIANSNVFVPNNSNGIFFNASGSFTDGLFRSGTDLHIRVGSAANNKITFSTTGMTINTGFTGGLTIAATTGVTLTISSTNVASITTAGGIKTGSTTLHSTSAALTNGAAAQTGTLTNSPSAGNPTKWVPIDDNGTTRYIPCW